MKALAITGYGDVSNAAIVDVADRDPGPRDVVVDIKAAALNHLDLWTLSGAVGRDHDLPHPLGADGAGEVARVGDEVRGIRPGDRVLVNPAISCGHCEFCRAGEQSLCTTFKMLGEHLPGTIAEQVVVPQTNVYPIPQHLSFAQAAALGVTAITAYRMLFTKARLLPGEWVLITGIGGGLALSLVQFARPIAGKIFVTSSSRDKLDRAIALGADGGIDYKAEDVGKAVRARTAKRGVDVVADSAGGPSLDGALRALRKGGRLVIAGATAGPRSDLDVRRLFWNQLQVIGSTMGSDHDVSEMLRMVAGTKLEPIIDKTFAFADAPQALAYLERQQQFGKIVVEI
ncbi:MAG: alcohol dehydrogenase catalytic domain-containing protein [Actinomycetota bacterium]|nr:alcohol dehydrogenase catalytic domain-containing protein [Actinomycetota bacterium]